MSLFRFDRTTHVGRVASKPELLLERIVKEETKEMLWTIFVILLILWLLGIVSSYTLGGYIHLLLVIAVVVLLIRLIQGRRPIV